MTLRIKCSKCGSIKWTKATVTENLLWDGERYEIEFDLWVCADCGEDTYTTPEQDALLLEKLKAAAKDEA